MICLFDCDGERCQPAEKPCAARRAKPSVMDRQQQHAEQMNVREQRASPMSNKQNAYRTSTNQQARQQLYAVIDNNAHSIFMAWHAQNLGFSF